MADDVKIQLLEDKVAALEARLVAVKADRDAMELQMRNAKAEAGNIQRDFDASYKLWRKLADPEKMHAYINGATL